MNLLNRCWELMELKHRLDYKVKNNILEVHLRWYPGLREIVEAKILLEMERRIVGSVHNGCSFTWNIKELEIPEGRSIGELQEILYDIGLASVVVEGNLVIHWEVASYTKWHKEEE